MAEFPGEWGSTFSWLAAPIINPPHITYAKYIYICVHLCVDDKGNIICGFCIDLMLNFIQLTTWTLIKKEWTSLLWLKTGRQCSSLKVFKGKLFKALYKNQSLSLLATEKWSHTCFKCTLNVTSRKDGRWSNILKCGYRWGWTQHIGLRSETPFVIPALCMLLRQKHFVILSFLYSFRGRSWKYVRFNLPLDNC